MGHHVRAVQVPLDEQVGEELALHPEVDRVLRRLRRAPVARHVPEVHAVVAREPFRDRTPERGGPRGAVAEDQVRPVAEALPGHGATTPVELFGHRAIVTFLGRSRAWPRASLGAWTPPPGTRGTPRQSSSGPRDRTSSSSRRWPTFRPAAPWTSPAGRAATHAGSLVAGGRSPRSTGRPLRSRRVARSTRPSTGRWGTHSRLRFRPTSTWS